MVASLFRKGEGEGEGLLRVPRCDSAPPWAPTPHLTPLRLAQRGEARKATASMPLIALSFEKHPRKRGRDDFRCLLTRSRLIHFFNDLVEPFILLSFL